MAGFFFEDMQTPLPGGGACPPWAVCRKKMAQMQTPVSARPALGLQKKITFVVDLFLNLGISSCIFLRIPVIRRAFCVINSFFFALFVKFICIFLEAHSYIFILWRRTNLQSWITGPQFLDIIKQARKKQPIHEVFRNEDLTKQIVIAGYTQRRPPSSSSNFYILPSALSHFY